MYNAPKIGKNKPGFSKPNILVKKRNESSDNASNTSSRGGMMSKNIPKPNIPSSNHNKKNSFMSNGPFRHIDTSNDNEPLIKTGSSRRRVDEDFPSQATPQESLNCINVAVSNNGEDNYELLDNKIHESEDNEVKLETESNPTKLKIEDQEMSHTQLNQEDADQNRSSSTLNKSASKPTVFSRRLEELKRQQAKLDKIKSEKDQLQAFLDYQAELEREKQRKEEENQMKLHQLIIEKAVIMQKYARRWLARRVFLSLQEEEYQRQKMLLTQALDEMTDHVRV